MGTITDLGTLGGASSAGGGIDGSGDVVGNSVLTGGANHAFLAMSSASAMTDLGSIRTQDRSGAPVAGNSVAKAIDRAGDEIVGWSETNDPRDLATNPQSYHATTWTLSNGVWAATDLGTLYAPANSGQNGTGCGSGDQQLGNATAVSYASAVNNSGTVVGVADYRLERCPALGSSPDFIYPFFGHAFRWTASGPMEDLGTLDNNTNASNDCAFSQANGENGAGDVVGFLGSEALGGWGTFTNGCSGYASTDTNFIGHAFLLPAGSHIGAMVDLGEPAGGTGEHNDSSASAINTNGDIAVNATSNDGVSHG